MPEASPTIAAELDSEFDRPVFIVSSPRSGAELLFDTLMRAPRVFTVGAESHKLVESIDALNVRAHDYDSNRLLAEHATAEVAAELRQLDRSIDARAAEGSAALGPAGGRGVSSPPHATRPAINAAGTTTRSCIRMDTPLGSNQRRSIDPRIF